MQFIEIKSGLRVKIKNIESIEEVIGNDIAQTKETVITMESGRSYATDWPIDALLMMLNMESSPEYEGATVKLEPKVMGILEQQGAFAG